MKTVLIAMALIAFNFATFATKLVSKSGHIRFYSHTAIEDIEANNRQGVSILDTETGDIQISILVKSFEFKIALMQEHFNENYMESSKFPKASFKGKVDQLNNINFKTDGVYTSNVTGELTIHGVTKTLTVPGTFEVKGGVVTAKAKFTVSPKEFGIAIPSLVENKIAKDIEITVDLPYTN
jgi:polyisoprenoid-binding protein YceI